MGNQNVTLYYIALVIKYGVEYRVYFFRIILFNVGVFLQKIIRYCIMYRTVRLCFLACRDLTLIVMHFL